MRDVKCLIDVHHTVAGLNTLLAGSALSSARLCQNLVNQGIRTSIHTLDLGPSFGDLIMPQQSDVLVYYSKCWVFKRFKLIVPHGFSKDLFKTASSAMVLHSHGVWLPINHSSAIFTKKTAIPHIISPHGMLEPWALKYKSMKKTIAWHLYQKEDLKNAAVFCASSVKEAESIRKLGFKQPIAVISNGVDLPELPQEANEIKEVFNALFLSRIHPVKGVLDLIEAWRRMKVTGNTRIGQWRLKIVGPAEEGYDKKILTAIRKGNLERDIDVLGPIYGCEKQKLFNEADLFVLPTHSENFGIVVAEALASGVPVITTKGAPWCELETYHCGWWTDVGVEPLVEALFEATTLSRSDLHAMGLRGRKLVEEKYTWPKAAAEMKGVYEWTIHGGTTPSCMLKD